MKDKYVRHIVKHLFNQFDDEDHLKSIGIDKMMVEEVEAYTLPSELYLLFKNHHLDDSGQDSCIGVFSDIQTAKKFANDNYGSPLEWDEEDFADTGRINYVIHKVSNQL